MALRGQTLTLLLLSLAVLFAYYQKSKNAATAPRMNVTGPIQGPQLPEATSLTLSAITQEVTDAMHHIPTPLHMPHLPLTPIPLPTIPPVTHVQKPHTPSVPRVNLFKYLAYIPSPISLIRYVVVVQARLVAFLLSTTVVLLRTLFAPILTLLAPVIVLLSAVFNILILAPYRAIVYMGKLLYPIYVFVGSAVILGACIGIAGGTFHSAVVMPTFEPEAGKSKRRSLKGKAQAQALGDAPPLSFPEREKLHDVTKWVEASWYVCPIVQRYRSKRVLLYR
jgi:hypothetical protein